jgi:lysozyme
MAMRTNQAGIELIKDFEGFRSSAYLCPADVWTVGYGHTSAAGAPLVVQGTTVSQSEAETILKRDLQTFEKVVSDAVTVPLNENQFAALVSFVFNIGPSAFRTSTLLAKLNDGDYLGASKEFGRWVKGNAGERLPGLERRRAAERSLFESPVEDQGWRVIQDTVFKREPVQSSELPDTEKMAVAAGTELDVLAGARVEANGENGLHFRITLNPDTMQTLIERKGFNTWHVFAGHVTAPREFWQPKQDEPVKPPSGGDRTKLPPFITLPGITGEISVYQPVYQGSNFTWAEMTKNGERIPINSTITGRLVKLARYMDGVRAYLGNRPIIVTSAYRDPDTNKRVGGARNSRHMHGDAIDFYVQGEDVVTTFNKLKSYHTTGGLAVSTVGGFIHLDLRPNGPARWYYPGSQQIPLW